MKVLETESAYTMPETKSPTNPSALPIVPTTPRFWSRTISPVGPPTRTVPLPRIGAGGTNRWLEIGVGSPSTVVIGSSQSYFVRFHRPIPPWVETRMCSPNSTKSVTMLLGRPANRLPWAQDRVSGSKIWKPAELPAQPISPMNRFSPSWRMPSIWLCNAGGVCWTDLWLRLNENSPFPTVVAQISCSTSIISLMDSSRTSKPYCQFTEPLSRSSPCSTVDARYEYSDDPTVTQT